MTSKSELHEIVRRIEDGDPERGFPCFVGRGGDVESCERPAAMTVYGLTFCEVHGEECADGALEEMHQDASEFFDRFDAPAVPAMDNPLVRAALSQWERAIPEGLQHSEGRADDLLLGAFPFREDKVAHETAAEIADPIPGKEHPYDSWRQHRYEFHQLMRHAYRLGMTYAVENLEEDREWVASQCAYALALSRGEHPEVLERAHQENVESARKVGELLGN